MSEGSKVNHCKQKLIITVAGKRPSSSNYWRMYYKVAVVAICSDIRSKINLCFSTIGANINYTAIISRFNIVVMPEA